MKVPSAEGPDLSQIISVAITFVFRLLLGFLNSDFCVPGLFKYWIYRNCILWFLWPLGTTFTYLYLLAWQMRISFGDSGLSCYVHVTSFVKR